MKNEKEKQRKISRKENKCKAKCKVFQINVYTLNSRSRAQADSKKGS